METLSQQQLDYQCIQQTVEYLVENVNNPPTIQELATDAGVSPSHLQHSFTEWAGGGPKEFLRFLAPNYLKKQIQSTQSIGTLADTESSDWLINIEGCTSATFKNINADLVVFYGYHDTLFGRCFLAATNKAICAITFLQDGNQKEEFELFAKKWSFARLIEDTTYTQLYVDQLFLKNQSKFQKLNVLVQGTPFQIKVWEALLNIPEGRLTTYQNIAMSIDKPKAARAVGTAIGKNPIGYLIPCHRVIRKEGKLGHYRWGSGRKKAIIGWEMMQQAKC